MALPPPSSTGRYELKALLGVMGGFTREGFAAAIGVPFLLQLSEVAVGEVHKRTANFQTIIPGAEAVEAAVKPLALGAYAVQKRPGANAFGLMITLGRAPNNDLVVGDPAVSKFHASFTRDVNGHWLVTDSSSGGTSLDGTKLERDKSQPIRSGARLTLAQTVVFRFLAAEEMYDYLVQVLPRIR